MQLQEVEILVVDDEVNFRCALGRLLEKQGYKVLVIGSSEEAENLLKHTTVHLIITDVRMPGMDGIEFLARVKAQYAPVEVAIISADMTAREASQAVRLGAYAILLKPFEKEQFLAMVARALAKYPIAALNARLQG